MITADPNLEFSLLSPELPVLAVRLGPADTTPPVLTAVSPFDGQVNVAANSLVELLLFDVSGIDLSSVVLTINAGAGAETVYTGSAFQSGFSGSVVAVDSETYRFTFTRAASFPSLQLVVVGVSASDTVGNTLTDSYSFTAIEQFSTASIGSVFVLARDLIKINISGTELSLTSSYFDTDNYSIVSLVTSNSVAVKQVLPVSGYSADSILLSVKGMTIGEQHQVSVSGLRDIVGKSILATSFTFTPKRTKLDTVVDSLSKMYAVRNRGNLRGLIEAVTISDEEIGGDF